MNKIELVPIGKVCNQVKEWQQVIWEDIVSQIVLDEVWTEALDGLEEFSHIWVITWLDRLPQAERGTSLKVHPQRREDLPLVGLFATRAPSRPNPIGLTAVPLLERKGNVLLVKGLDMLDGTPVLDIKPYLSRGDKIGRVREAAWLRRLRRQPKGRSQGAPAASPLTWRPNSE